MSFKVVIPARYGSSRLIGKPLLDLAGRPMIEHVYRRAEESLCAQVIVATDDERIANVVTAFGGEVCLTRADHASGTDRIQEVATTYGWTDDTIVVNVQGDEPLIPPDVINQVATNLRCHPQASVASLSEPLTTIADFMNPNCVKVVSDIHGMALYFSRAPMPWPRDANLQNGDVEWSPDQVLYQRHIGIYAYRVGLLNRFVTWPASPLENIEKLEQLRVLWQGEKIHMAAAVAPVPGGIDTAEDVDRILATLNAENSL